MMITPRISSVPVALVLLFCGARGPTAIAAAPEAAQLNWVGQPASSLAHGVSWGVPWPQGTLARDATFNLVDAQGKSLPLQTWPLAYWPDGSLKWSGLATVVPAGT